MCAEVHIEFIFCILYCYHKRYMKYFYEMPINTKALCVCVCVCVFCAFVCVKKYRNIEYHTFFGKVFMNGMLLNYNSF